MQRVYTVLAAVFIHIAMFFESISFWFNERVKTPQMSLDEAQKTVNQSMVMFVAHVQENPNPPRYLH